MKSSEKARLRTQEADQCHLGLGVGVKINCTDKWGSFWADRNVLALDCGDDYTTL